MIERAPHYTSDANASHIMVCMSWFITLFLHCYNHEMPTGSVPVTAQSMWEHHPLLIVCLCVCCYTTVDLAVYHEVSVPETPSFLFSSASVN